jgi:CHASE3 domain sensor protein
MSGIEFSGTVDERRAQVEAFCRRIDGDFYGRSGLMEKVSEFMTRMDATEVERMHQHKQNRDRLNIIIAILVAIAAYIAIAISVHGLPKSSAIPMSSTQTVASSQTATLPNMR